MGGHKTRLTNKLKKKALELHLSQKVDETDEEFKHRLEAATTKGMITNVTSDDEKTYVTVKLNNNEYKTVSAVTDEYYVPSVSPTYGENWSFNYIDPSPEVKIEIYKDGRVFVITFQTGWEQVKHLTLDELYDIFFSNIRDQVIKKIGNGVEIKPWQNIKIHIV